MPLSGPLLRQSVEKGRMLSAREGGAVVLLNKNENGKMKLYAGKTN